MTDSTMPILAVCLDENYPYDELAPSITTMHTACTALVQELINIGVTLEAVYLK